MMGGRWWMCVDVSRSLQKLQDNITNIKCPVFGCDKGSLEPQHCRSILPKEVFDRWGDALCEAVVLGSERFYCPFKDCPALLIDDARNEVVIQESECPSCNRLFCARCKVPWHSGVVCAEFEKLREYERGREDIMVMNMAKEKKWRRCGRCNFYVEKSRGCSAMRCRCGNYFCYNCGHQFSSGLSHHHCRIYNYG